MTIRKKDNHEDNNTGSFRTTLMLNYFPTCFASYARSITREKLANNRLQIHTDILISNTPFRFAPGPGKRRPALFSGPLPAHNLHVPILAGLINLSVRDQNGRPSAAALYGSETFRFLQSPISWKERSVIYGVC